MKREMDDKRWSKRTSDLDDLLVGALVERQAGMEFRIVHISIVLGGHLQPPLNFQEADTPEKELLCSLPFHQGEVAKYEGHGCI